MEERSTVAVGAVLACCGALGAIVYWLGFVDPPKKFEMKVYDAEAPVVDAGPSPAEVQSAIWSAQQKFAADKNALRTKKPKTRADVEKLMGRPADVCTDDPVAGTTYCRWYYADKPAAEGRDQVGVTLKSDKVLFVDN